MASRGGKSKTDKRRDTAAAQAKRSIEAGRRAAEEIHRGRTAVLKQRNRAIRAATPRGTRDVVPVEPRRLRAAGEPGIATLVAEGDSWFDYFWYDVLDLLEAKGYDVEEVAHQGDRVEDMAYADNELLKFRKLIEKLLRRGEVPKAILLSGGGNDVAGDEFALLLDHAKSATPGLNEDVVRGVIDVRIRNAFLYILSAVTETCVSVIGRAVPILVHGYARPVPDGRGVLGGAWILPGPWLRPGFHQKGYPDLEMNRATVGKLIDRFNTMLKQVVSTPGFGHVHYVDLRDVLKNDAGYKDWWGNELHPTEKGFKAVTRRYVEVIETL
jgi:lysophospholipase L1-like esterase